MIKTLNVQNFTTLPDATWTFAPGLNVIVGENGFGKSHVLKLLYALLKVSSEAKAHSAANLERAYASKLMGGVPAREFGAIGQTAAGARPL